MNKFLGYVFQKLEREQDRQTDRHTTEHITSHIRRCQKFLRRRTTTTQSRSGSRRETPVPLRPK